MTDAPYPTVLGLAKRVDELEARLLAQEIWTQARTPDDDDPECLDGMYEMHKRGVEKGRAEAQGEIDRLKSDLDAERDAKMRALSCAADYAEKVEVFAAQRDRLAALLRRFADRMTAVNGDVGPAFIAELRLEISAALAELAKKP